MRPPIFHPQSTISLPHHGDCSLLGVTPDGQLYLEEIYSDDGWMAQHIYSADGVLMHSVDEMDGANTEVKALELPINIVKPRIGWHTMGLNYAGARHRGMRINERLADVVKPMSIPDKMTIAKRLNVQVVVGIAESYVVAEVELVRPNLFLTCRRIRFAFALPEEHVDDNGDPYDYDTQVIYVAHLLDLRAEEERPIIDLLNDLPGVFRPMDCLLLEDRLYVADGGAEDRPNRIHIWRVDWTEKPLPPEEQIKKKIYG